MGLFDALSGIFGGSGAGDVLRLPPATRKRLEDQYNRQKRAEQFDPNNAKKYSDPQWQTEHGYYITTTNPDGTESKPKYMPGTLETDAKPIPLGYPAGYVPSDYKPYSAQTSEGFPYNPDKEGMGPMNPTPMSYPPNYTPPGFEPYRGADMESGKEGTPGYIPPSTSSDSFSSDTSPGFTSSLGGALGFVGGEGQDGGKDIQKQLNGAGGALGDIANVIGLIQYRNAMKRHTAWLQDVAKNPRYPNWLMQDWTEQGSAGGQGKYWENYQSQHPGGQGLPTRPVAPQPQPKPKQ